MMASNGDFAMVYATPEKLLGWESGLKKLAKNSKLICLAIDESHCVSDWGHDFRPQYRQLIDIRRVIGYDVPVVALTASATVQVQSDIINTLRLRDPIIVKMPLNRVNLKYFVVHKNGPNDVVTLLWRFRREQLAESGVDKSAGKSIPFHATLVYVNSKREANEISTLLSRCKSIEGLGVAAYHADLPTEERNSTCNVLDGQSASHGGDSCVWNGYRNVFVLICRHLRNSMLRVSVILIESPFLIACRN